MKKKFDWKTAIIITFCSIGILAFGSQATTNLKDFFNKEEEKVEQENTPNEEASIYNYVV